MLAGVAVAGAVLPTQGETNLAVRGLGQIATKILSEGAVRPGQASYASTGPSATVTLSAPRTLIDWTTFEVGGGSTLTYAFGGSASDLVINRVASGPIKIDAGGTVKGVFDGARGGNIWFLSSRGVFIHGTVTAGGVLAATNPRLGDLDLLSGNLSGLKSQLAAGGGLANLQGVAAATGLTVDSSGNIVLTGEADAGRVALESVGAMTLAGDVHAPGGDVLLKSGGRITQTDGVITAQTLTGVSRGATMLKGANQVSVLAGLTSGGSGTLVFNDAIATGLTVTGPVDAGAGEVDITTTAPGARLTLAADVTTIDRNVVRLISAGPIAQTAGAIRTGSLSGASVGGTSLSGPNQIGAVSAFANRESGAITLNTIGSLAVVGLIDNGGGGDGAAQTRDIAITVSGGDLTGTGAFRANGDIALQADDGGIAFKSALAGNSIVLRAAGALSVSDYLQSGYFGSAESESGAGAALAEAQPTVLFGGPGPAQTGGDIDIVASRVFVGGAIGAAGPGSDVRIVANGADDGASSLTLNGPVEASRDIALDATGSRSGSVIVESGLSAERDVAVRSVKGSISLGSAAAGDDVVLAATQGDLTLGGSATAQGEASMGIGQRLFSLVSAPLEGLFALGPQSLFLTAKTYANTGYGESGATLTADRAIGLFVSDASGLTLADADPDTTNWVQAATLQAPMVSLFASGGPILALDSTLYAPVSRLSLYTGSTLTVTGVLAPAEDGGASLAVGAATAPDWTPSAIRVINDGVTGRNHGAIGFAAAHVSRVARAASRSGGAFDRISLSARESILLGSQAFVDATSAASRPGPSTTGAITLAGGDVALAAGQRILQQDTGGPFSRYAPAAGVGSAIGGSLALAGYGGATPTVIDLYGDIAGRTGADAAAGSQIALSSALANDGDRSAYRFNNCRIGAVGACGDLTSLPRGVLLDPLSQGVVLAQGDLTLAGPARFPDMAFGSNGLDNPGVFVGGASGGPDGGGGFGFQGSGGSSGASGDDAGGGGGGGGPGTVDGASPLYDPYAALGLRSAHPAILLDWQLRNGLLRFDEPDIEDRRITGAASEEIWRVTGDHP